MVALLVPKHFSLTGLLSLYQWELSNIFGSDVYFTIAMVKHLAMGLCIWLAVQDTR